MNNQQPNYNQSESLFLALTDKTRLRILNLMHAGEVCVNDFTSVLEESQPKISRHLAYLRSAGIVATRRQGKWIHYYLQMPSNGFASRLLGDVLRWLYTDVDMRNDLARLAEIAVPHDADRIEVMADNISAGTDVNYPVKRDELEIHLL